MSYYILTPASNLKIILASEAIAPAALYPMRKSGFGSFDALSGEKDFALMRLYRKCPSLAKREIIEDASNAAQENKENNENAEITLMAIEIPEDCVSVIESEDGEIWTDNTVYLFPNSEYSFIFENEVDLDSAFNALERGIEQKFADKYRKVSIVQNAPDELFPHEPPKGNHAPNIKLFNALDRLKGALYCWFLDDSLSVATAYEDNYIEYMKIVESLINATTQEQTSSVALSDNLNSLSHILWKMACEKESKEPTSKDFDVEERSNDIKKGASVEPPDQNRKNEESYLDAYRSTLEERARKAAGKRKQGRWGIKIESKGDVIGSGLSEDSGSNASNDEVSQKYEIWVKLPEKEFGSLAGYLINSLIRKDVVSSVEINKDIDGYGYRLAIELAKIVKSHCKGNWNEDRNQPEKNSPEQKYVNGLLEHLNNHEEFDMEEKGEISDENFQVLKTLAYLCSKEKNKDLEDFYRMLLVEKGVSDFRLPLAIWGAVFGFSQMPKTLTDSMSRNSQDKARKLFKVALDALRKKEEATPPAEEKAEVATPGNEKGEGALPATEEKAGESA